MASRILLFEASAPHRQAIFSLLPANERTIKILEDSRNRPLVSQIPDGRGNNFVGIGIGPHLRSNNKTTLATIGRKGDIKIDDPSISKIQCSFEVHPTSGAILVVDSSSWRSTKLFGKFPFLHDRAPRVVMIAPGVNEILQIGPPQSQYTFEIHWHENADLNLCTAMSERPEFPSTALTVQLETGRPTPFIGDVSPMNLITTAQEQGNIRFCTKATMGQGAFGRVESVYNVDSGELIAAKFIRPDSGVDISREIKAMSNLRHPNIVEYISAQIESPWVVLFMHVKEGSISSLAEADYFGTREAGADPQAYRVLEDTLQALIYLDEQGIIHRDVKPDNILYKFDPAVKGYRYQLADFGLSNIVENAQSFAGTRAFMAPELRLATGSKQSTKMDVWSLFVTFLYITNHSNTRWLLKSRPDQVHDKHITSAASSTDLKNWRTMAEIEPEYRSSAYDIFHKNFSKEEEPKPTTHYVFPDIMQGLESQLSHQKPQSKKVVNNATVPRSKSTRIANQDNGKVRKRKRKDDRQPQRRRKRGKTTQ